MQHITLRDGMRLTYTWFGRPLKTHVVVYVHGFPSSRLEGKLLHKDAVHLGLSVLAVDRPGAGGSTYNPQLVSAGQNLLPVVQRMATAKASQTFI